MFEQIRMDTSNPRKLGPRRLSSREAIGVNNIFVTLYTSGRNNVVGESFVTEVFDVIPNLVPQLRQTTRQPIMNDVSGHSVTPGWVTVSG